jgi:hypothetical protein
MGLRKKVTTMAEIGTTQTTTPVISIIIMEAEVVVIIISTVEVGVAEKTTDNLVKMGIMANLKKGSNTGTIITETTTTIRETTTTTTTIKGITTMTEIGMTGTKLKIKEVQEVSTKILIGTGLTTTTITTITIGQTFLLERTETEATESNTTNIQAGTMNQKITISIEVSIMGEEITIIIATITIRDIRKEISMLETLYKMKEKQKCFMKVAKLNNSQHPSKIKVLPILRKIKVMPQTCRASQRSYKFSHVDKNVGLNSPFTSCKLVYLLVIDRLQNTSAIS